jgi:N-acetylglucosaminyldiphosphoundecaprenol N-acetyl-beta-D-mannosaminyltransferase
MARRMREGTAPQRVRLLGGEVDLVTPREVLAFVGDAVAARRPATVANHNAHSLFLLRRSAELRAFFAAADLVEIDSTPLIAWGRLLGLPLRRAMRSTYLDWRDDFWRLAAGCGWRVFYLGGAPGVAERAAQRLASRYPGVTIGCRHGFFDDDPASADSRRVIAGIAGFDPDVVMVGMGMPRQELWALRHRADLPRAVMLTVGAAFDYEAGAQWTPPRWTGRLGVEWLARLASQPRRLAVRYLVEPWWLIGPALADIAAAVGRPGR